MNGDDSQQDIEEKMAGHCPGRGDAVAACLRHPAA
jgi:hypothetical protein